MTVSSGDVLATVNESVVLGEELNTAETVTETVVVQPDNSEVIAQLETLNECVGLILALVLAYVVWLVIRNVYNLFSMFFSF